jgi:DNA-binding transcriptional MocR family regulator
VAESGGLVLPPVKAGSIWSARAAAFARCDLGGASSRESSSRARLPPERELARDCGVAYDTVRRAAVLLRERGLIVTVHGRGTYVA